MWIQFLPQKVHIYNTKGQQILEIASKKGQHVTQLNKRHQLATKVCRFKKQIYTIKYFWPTSNSGVVTLLRVGYQQGYPI